jgi:hypothetical protein
MGQESAFVRTDGGIERTEVEAWKRVTTTRFLRLEAKKGRIRARDEKVQSRRSSKKEKSVGDEMSPTENHMAPIN